MIAADGEPAGGADAGRPRETDGEKQDVPRASEAKPSRASEPKPPRAMKDSKRKAPRVLPTSADSDSFRAWGDSDDSNDERLRREKPPHW